MLIDMREPWVEQICFTTSDYLRKQDGKWVHCSEPEDWNFSRQCRRVGVRAYVTRAVTLTHNGQAAFNTSMHRGHQFDPTNMSTQTMEIKGADGAKHDLLLGRNDTDVPVAGANGVADGVVEAGKEE